MGRQRNSVCAAFFTQAVTRVLAIEEGRLRFPGGPDGETKFAISDRDYPAGDLAMLKRDRAIAIYFRDFGKGGRHADLFPAIAIERFDLSVNMGAAQATRCLQRVGRVRERGARGRRARRRNGSRRRSGCAAAGCRRRCARRRPATIARRCKGPARRTRAARGWLLEGWLDRAHG
jgi:lysozyme family protein